MSTSKLSKRFMSLHCHCIVTEKLAILFLIVSDFLHLKITIRISYKYRQINVHNLVYLFIYIFSLYSLIGR